MNLIRRTAAVMLAAVIIISSFAGVSASASDYSFKAYNLKLHTRDSVIALTQDTSKYSDLWASAHITDASSKLDEFEKMGIVAYFYDTETGADASFLVKQSQETAEKFSFAGMSDEDVKEYVTDIMSGNDEVSLDVDVYKHPQTTFFKLKISSVINATPASEVIYGTLINGQMVQFDVFKDGPGTPDESLVLEILDSLEFTKILTYEEYQELSRQSLRKLLFILLGILAVFGAVVAIAVISRRRMATMTARISDEMQSFRERKRNGEAGSTEHLLFSAPVAVDDDAVGAFIIYDTWFRRFFRTASCLLVIGTITVLMFKAESTIGGLAAIALGVGFLYTTFSASEKRRDSLAKQNSDKVGRSLVLSFYEDCFILTGAGSPVEYIYAQVTAVRGFHGYMFIYTGEGHAIIVPQDKVGDPGRLADYLKGKMLR